MTRRRRATVLLALAAALGLLSATHMSRREAALRAQLGPVTEVVVARADLKAGATLELDDLGVRELPARYAPPGEPAFAAALAGHKLAVPVPAGGAVTAELLAARAADAGVAGQARRAGGGRARERLGRGGRAGRRRGQHRQAHAARAAERRGARRPSRRRRRRTPGRA